MKPAEIQISDNFNDSENDNNFLLDNDNDIDQDNQLIKNNSPPLVTSKITSINNSHENLPGIKGSLAADIFSNQNDKFQNEFLNAKKEDIVGTFKNQKMFDHTSEINSIDQKNNKKKQIKDPDRQPIDSGNMGGDDKEGKDGGDENDSFHRLYNKEIKVNQDEIPLLLLELTDIAYKFIKKDQYEKAYVLLQKTESVLEVVNLEHSKRDKYFAYITYHNMAMCFQKLGMLEECIIYIKETISVIEKPNFFKDISISQRMKQLHMQCQLKLQLCAILSQTQKHTDAMENAKQSVRLGHQILRDMYDLCVFYSNKIKFKDDFASLSLLIMEEDENNKGESSENQQKQNELNEKLIQKNFIKENSPVKDIPYNILEESISMIERTALKLLPIMKELGNRLAGTNGKKGHQAFHAASVIDKQEIDLLNDINLDQEKKDLQSNLMKKMSAGNWKNEFSLTDQDEDIDGNIDIKDIDLKVEDVGDKSQKAENGNEMIHPNLVDQIDMRTVLGFLNQNEWILNLNIGNIMQIQPVRMKDFMQTNRNEHLLQRESFLEKLQLLIVSYFCVSTEMRFIVQSRSGFMKPEVKKEKELEQEYWHVKALDIACAFLPSECPLFNHILLSYQKHHDPAMHAIDEDNIQEDIISILRPLKGIENSKYQPIVREVNNVFIDIPEIAMSPLSKCFDKRLLPKKVQQKTINIQTDLFQKPPLMKSQSINIQDDLSPKNKQIADNKNEAQKIKNKDSQTLTDTFDVQNAYLDLSNSKYQEKLISQIINDPQIQDKSKFLNKLMTRVKSQQPEKFTKNKKYNKNNIKKFNNYMQTNLSYANTQSQNLDHNSHFASYQNNIQSTILKGTLSADPEIEKVDDIYGKNRQSLIGKGTKISQSGFINYQYKSSLPKKSKINNDLKNNFDPMELSSFDQKSQQVQNHVRSMYGDANTSNDVTTIIGATKHHIASQSLAPSNSVLTVQKLKKKNFNTNKNIQQQILTHEKNKSISVSEDYLNKENFKNIETQMNNLNNSANSISEKSVKERNLKQKQNKLRSETSNKMIKEYDQKSQQKKNQLNHSKLSKAKNEKLISNINLSNEKISNSKKSSQYMPSQNQQLFQKKQQQKSNSNEKKKFLQIQNTQHFFSIKKNLDKNINKNEIRKNNEIIKIPTSMKEQNEQNDNSKINQYMSDSSRSASYQADTDILLQPNSSCDDTRGFINAINHNKSPKQIIQTQSQIQKSQGQSLDQSDINTTQILSQNLGKNKMTEKKKSNNINENLIILKEPFKRPSSAITNYTTSVTAQNLSNIKGKKSKQRLQYVQNLNRNQMSQKINKVQQQSQQVINQFNQRQIYNGAQILKQPSKKTKVISRKKYGSDKSSSSPIQNQNISQEQTLLGDINGGYSIAQQPLSIFDSGCAQSTSKASNIQPNLSNMKNSEGYRQNFLVVPQKIKKNILVQNQMNIQKLISKNKAEKKNQNNNIQGKILQKNSETYNDLQHTDQQKTGSKRSFQHSNSQTLNIEKKLKQQQKLQQNNYINNSQTDIQQSSMIGQQNQSENILAKLQNLLQNKEEQHASNNQQKRRESSKSQTQINKTKKQLQQQKNQNINNLRSGNQANSGGSLRQSRFSQISKGYSRSKSRISKSKSSGKQKSGEKNIQASRSRSKDRLYQNEFDTRGQNQNYSNKVLKKQNNFEIIGREVSNSVLGESQQNLCIVDENSIFINQPDVNDKMQTSFEQGRTEPITYQNRKKHGIKNQNLRNSRPKSSLFFDNNQLQIQQKHQLLTNSNIQNSLYAQASNNQLYPQQKLATQYLNNKLNNIENKRQSSSIALNNQIKHNKNYNQNQINIIKKQGQRISNPVIEEIKKQSKQSEKLNQNNFKGNLQKQLLQNQQILLKNMHENLNIQKQIKRNTLSVQYNNHQAQNNQQQQSQNTIQSQTQTQNILNKYNTSQILNQLTQNVEKKQQNDISFKTTQNNLTQNLKLIDNGRTAAQFYQSTTTSTNGANQFLSGKSMKTRKNQRASKRRGSISNNLQTGNSGGFNNNLVNFEQMQKQLNDSNKNDNFLTIGGVDLSQQQQNISYLQQNLNIQQQVNQFNLNQQMGFIPHKNLLPKTTGSQAHLLTTEECNNLKYNSMNQTGRATGSINPKNLIGQQLKRKKNMIN